MKKILLLFAVLIGCNLANAQQRLSIKGGILAPYTLDATVAYEKTTGDNAYELFGEAGNHWQHPTCHRFWKGYFWDAGASYKFGLKNYKNGNLRFVAGAYCGADRKDFFFGAQLGFEYNYIFANNWVFTVEQKNNFNFLHGDTFRNGLLVGLKIPI